MRLVIILLSSLLVACHQARHPCAQDPFEPLNRKIFGFNKAVDRAVLKPVARLYVHTIPKPLQTTVCHFFNNIGEIPNTANDLLQGQWHCALQDASRFCINTTIGVLGLFDPASYMGLERRKQDFGQTLYRWGYQKSSYVMVPFLGPSTVRDAVGFVVDYTALSLWPWIPSEPRNILLGVEWIEKRAQLLSYDNVMANVALDEYEFIRDAYFQRRRYLFQEAEEEGKFPEPTEEGPEPLLDIEP